jgi:hypothetical protein
MAGFQRKEAPTSNPVKPLKESQGIPAARKSNVELGRVVYQFESIRLLARISHTASGES